VHVTLSREMFGPDVAASVTSSELRTLVDGVRAIEAALASPVDKDTVAAELAPMRTLFSRSLVARHALPAGHVLEAGDLVAKKAGRRDPTHATGDARRQAPAPRAKNGRTAAREGHRAHGMS